MSADKELNNALGRAMSTLEGDKRKPIEEYILAQKKRIAELEAEKVSLTNDLAEKQEQLDQLANKCLELEAENKRLKEANEWKPIETAPKDGSRFLAGVDRASGFLQYVAWWDDEFSDWVITSSLTNIICPTPSHWMPLPEPPKEQGS